MAAAAPQREFRSSTPVADPGLKPGDLEAPAPVPAARGRFRTLWVVLTATALLSAGLGVAAVRTEALQLSYQMNALAQRKADASALHTRLQVELAALKSPERLGPAATALGLSAPDPASVIRVPAP